MIPVMQKFTVAEHGVGDCFNACVASILEKNIEEVHDILPNTPGVWFLNWRKWFHARGMSFEMCSKLSPPPGYSIVSIETERRYPDDHERAGARISHACVALDGKIIHDPFPHPSEIHDIQYYFEFKPRSDTSEDDD
jgi:hypothetical protein